MTAAVEIDHLTVQFGLFTAVKDVSLQIRQGEFFSFLGPSGCGKTTILRAISGFQDPTRGVIRIGGQDMSGIGPNQRPTALIFQNLALFPLMTVSENIGYGLRVRGVPKADRDRKVDELLNLIALSDQGHKKIEELSGGQKQRVAIARALAVEPKVLLLDEPLSALDLKLRQHMRNELRAIQRRVGVTFIYITHDQGEALTMSDRIAVMNRGKIEQVGNGRDVYEHPQTSFVASFVGENNGFTGTITKISGDQAEIETSVGRLVGLNKKSLPVGTKATLFIRPEAMQFGAQGENNLSGTAADAAYEGMTTHLTMKAHDGSSIVATLTGAPAREFPSQGSSVSFAFVTRDALILPA